MDALARLDDYLMKGTDEHLQGEDKPKFTIETKEQAIWALRKIAAIERDRIEARQAAQAEIFRIQDWMAGEEKRADQAREYLDFLLEDYHRRQIKQNPKLKTIKLPHGDLQLRAQQAEYQKDDDVIISWAKNNYPELVIQPPAPKPKLDWEALKKRLKVVDGKVIDPQTSEVIPGITVTERSAKFQIKLSGV